MPRAQDNIIEWMNKEIEQVCSLPDALLLSESPSSQLIALTLLSHSQFLIDLPHRGACDTAILPTRLR